MFAELASNPIGRLFVSPGWELELLGAAVFTLGVVCYLVRVVWLALSHTRKMEKRSMQSTVIPSDDGDYSGPYCAG